MEAKLKSISNRIHWSLVIKACALGLLWLLLPFWVFFLAAVYFYLIPFFQPFRLIIPFVLTIAVASFLPYNFWFAVFLGLLFFLILGIKNLIFVNRFDNHQLMVFLLLFLLFFSFFSGFENWRGLIVSWAALALGFSFYFLFHELAGYTSEHGRTKKIVIAALGSLLIWQAAVAVLFLPVNYFYQTAVLFLSSVILVDIFLEYLNGGLNRRKILSDFSIFFVLSAVILASASWGL